MKDEKIIAAFLRQLAKDYNDQAIACMRSCSVLDMNADEFEHFKRLSTKASTLFDAAEALLKGGDESEQNS